MQHARVPDRDLLRCQRGLKRGIIAFMCQSHGKKKQKKRTIKESEKINSNTWVSTSRHTRPCINTRRHGACVNSSSGGDTHRQWVSPLYSWLTVFLYSSQMLQISTGGPAGWQGWPPHDTPYWMLTTTDGSEAKHLWTCYTAGLKEDQAMLEGRAHQTEGAAQMLA